MNRLRISPWIGGCVLVFGSLATVVAGANDGDPEAARYGWLSSLELGQSRSRETGQPLMVILRCLP